jgi:hypothetical protein
MVDDALIESLADDVSDQDLDESGREGIEPSFSAWKNLSGNPGASHNSSKGLVDERFRWA